MSWSPRNAVCGINFQLAFALSRQRTNTYAGAAGERSFTPSSYSILKKGPPISEFSSLAVALLMGSHWADAGRLAIATRTEVKRKRFMIQDRL